MEKPITILYHDFLAGLENLINDSGLPAFAMIPLIRETLGQLERIEQEQYQSDLETYNKAQEESEAAT